MTHYTSKQALSRPLGPVVSVRGGQVVASSLDVAAYFGKAHKNVIQSIELLMADPAANGLIFQPIEYIDTRGRAKPAYAMTRDGFTLLVMGFTGQKATAFKLAYIREFNRMEAAVKAAPAPALPDFTNPAIAARAWADQFDRAEGAEKVARRLLAFPHSVGVREAAKMLKLPPQELSRMLREWKWTYVQGGGKRTVTLAYQSVIDRGWMVHDAYVTPDGRTVYHPKITPDGISKIARMTPAND